MSLGQIDNNSPFLSIFWYKIFCEKYLLLHIVKHIRMNNRVEWKFITIDLSLGVE
jgi:hypothetical protein